MKNNSTKIGYIVGTFPCRSETFIAREIKYLRDSGFDINVLTIESHEDNNKGNGIKVIYRTSIFSYQALSSIIYFLIKYPFALPKIFLLVLKLMRTSPRESFLLLSNFHTITSFVRFLDMEEISQIHAHFLSWPSIIGLSISIATGRDFSISAHARDIFVEHGAIELKASHAKFITTCTKDGLDYLKDNISEQYHEKVHLNYHVIKCDENSFESKEINSSDSKNIITSVGRLVPKKGFEYIIKAFASVSDQMPDCELVIIGEGPERGKIEDLIKHYSLEQNVKLTGWQTNDATLKFIREAKVLVVPSVITKDGDRDGIPNVILEAFACGTPVIASKLNSICEVIKHNKTGLLTEPENITELASAIKNLLTNKDLQNQLAQAAYKTAIEHFNPVKNTMQLAGLFQNINQ